MEEILGNLSWMDLGIIVLLAAGVFIGFTQGLIRYALSGIAVIVAFVLASQLKGPLTEALGFWTPATPEVKELWIFIGLFVGFVVGGWFLVRVFYKRTRLPIVKQADEVGGAILGLLFVALVLTFQLVVLDTFFRTTTDESAGFLKDYYDAMNSSLIIDFFRDTIIPTAGFLARPFVPDEIAAFLFPA